MSVVVNVTARVRDVFCFDLAPQIAAMPITVEVPAQCEIQLCITGAFYRVDMGHFKVTPRTLEKMMQNAQERGVDIPVNYHHLGNDPQAPIKSREAAGWVSPKSLRIGSYKGGQALFGMAVWTAEAAAALKGEKLRYISPEIEWAATRMAASEAGPAGAPIGPMLTAAALTNDPFFSMNPVTFSRRYNSARRYSMLSDTAKANILKLLKSAGVDATVLDGLMAQILVEIMTQAPETPEAPVVEEVMPAAAAAPAAEGTAQASLAASRDVNAALNKRLALLESRELTRETEHGAALYSRYESEGRFRIYAVADTDPTGAKAAKAKLAKGLAFFREVFDGVPPLTGQRPPAAATNLPRAGAGSANSFVEDQGRALHDRTMGELKAKGLKMTDYERVSAQFARQK